MIINNASNRILVEKNRFLTLELNRYPSLTTQDTQACLAYGGYTKPDFFSIVGMVGIFHPTPGSLVSYRNLPLVELLLETYGYDSAAPNLLDRE